MCTSTLHCSHHIINTKNFTRISILHPLVCYRNDYRLWIVSEPHYTHLIEVGNFQLAGFSWGDEERIFRRWRGEGMYHHDPITGEVCARLPILSSPAINWLPRTDLLHIGMNLIRTFRANQQSPLAPLTAWSSAGGGLLACWVWLGYEKKRTQNAEKGGKMYDYDSIRTPYSIPVYHRFQTSTAHQSHIDLLQIRMDFIHTSWVNNVWPDVDGVKWCVCESSLRFMCKEKEEDLKDGERKWEEHGGAWMRQNMGPLNGTGSPSQPSMIRNAKNVAMGVMPTWMDFIHASWQANIGHSLVSLTAWIMGNITLGKMR